MQKHIPIPLIGALAAALLFVAGCFGGGASESAAREEATAAPTQASAPTPTEAAASSAEATEAEATEAEATEAEATEIVTPTMEAASDVIETETAGTESAETTDVVANDAGAVRAAEDVPEINSYRTQITVHSATARGEDNIRVEGAHVKEPLAEQFLITIIQGDETHEIEVVKVDGGAYTRIGETWMQSPDGTIDNVAEMTLITPQNIASTVAQMDVVGTETVNGLAATHYRGSKEIIPAVGTAGDTLDVSRVESAQLDIWADETHNAIIKLSLEAHNSEPPMTATVTFDYTDLNSAIEIEAPETMPATDEASGDEEFEPRNELGVLLGFNLLFPTGSTVEMVVGTNLYTVVGPYTLEEATNMIELNMEANGYSQVSKATGSAGEVNYLFQMGEKVVSITLSDAEDGNTRFQFATGP